MTINARLYGAAPLGQAVYATGTPQATGVRGNSNGTYTGLVSSGGDYLSDLVTEAAGPVGNGSPARRRARRRMRHGGVGVPRFVKVGGTLVSVAGVLAAVYGASQGWF